MMEQLGWIVFILIIGIVCIVGITAIVVIARTCIDIMIKGLLSDIKELKQLEEDK